MDGNKKMNKFRGYRRLLSFLWPYWRHLLLAVVCMIFVSGSNLIVPWIIKDIVDQVLAEKNVQMLYMVIGAILVIFLIRGVTTFGHRYLMGYIGQRVITDLRQRLFCHLQKLSISYYDRRRTGEIMSNVTNDIGALQTAIVDNFVTLVQEARQRPHGAGTAGRRDLAPPGSHSGRAHRAELQPRRI